jgi:precorrin-3B synthase
MDHTSPVVRSRPDACPGAVDAAPAEDGLIARVRLPGGRLATDAARGVAACAAESGNGRIDLTVRANLQLRGLSTDGAAALAPRLAALGLMPAPAHDRVRNIVASPFAGRDPEAAVDGEALTAALDAALCADPELSALPGRFLFCVDDGGLPVATRRHDVVLAAVAPGAVALWVAGSDTGLRVSPAEAPAAALAAARAFLRLREEAGNGAWHVRELPGGGDALALALGGTPVPAAPPRPASRIGTYRQDDGRLAISALVPLGRLTAGQLSALADAADRAASGPGEAPAGAGRIRVAPWRGIVIGDVARPDMPQLVGALTALKFPADPASPWNAISACSGVGECRRAETDVRTLAAAYALTRPRTPAPIHFAACARACGRPAGAITALVTPDSGEAHADKAARTATDADAPTTPVVPIAGTAPPVVLTVTGTPPGTDPALLADDIAAAVAAQPIPPAPDAEHPAGRRGSRGGRTRPADQ